MDKIVQKSRESSRVIVFARWRRSPRNAEEYSRALAAAINELVGDPERELTVRSLPYYQGGA